MKGKEIQTLKDAPCVICKKPDKYSDEVICGRCIGKWLEKKETHISKAVVEKAIGDFESKVAISDEEELEEHIAGWIQRLKQKLRISSPSELDT